MQRIILLVDMDAFYTACEEVKNPELKGKPVAVGADPKQGHGRGVVATANYSARTYGIHSAMPISIAFRKCPDCIFLPVDMEYYIQVSDRVMKIIKSHADRFEQVSVDEAYADVSSKGSFEKARDIARKIKEEIFKKEKLTCSIGIGPNKLIAKMASGKDKPNGLTTIHPSGVQKFLDPLDVDELFGVGPKTREKLYAIGIKTIKQLKETPLSKLTEVFGPSYAQYLHDASRGIEESPVVEEYTAKSIGRHYTFEKDTKDVNLIHTIIDEMVDDCMQQLKQQNFKNYKTITIIVRYEDFETHTKAYTMIDKATAGEPAKNVARTLLRDFLKSEKKIRLIGISLSKLA